MAHRNLFAPKDTFDLSPFSLNGHLLPVFVTELGALFKGDCVDLLPQIRDECVDTVFADPPFNLGKEYGGNVNDLREENEYLDWCRKWIGDCVRILKPGGAFFLYNIPRWN